MSPQLAEHKARRAKWEKANRLRLVDRHGLCGHVLRKVRCPSKTRYACLDVVYEALDHGRVWQRQDGTRFILAHVYQRPEQALAAGELVAAERRLSVQIDMTADWYGCGTVPLRYELPPGEMPRARPPQVHPTRKARRALVSKRECLICGLTVPEDRSAIWWHELSILVHGGECWDRVQAQLRTYDRSRIGRWRPIRDLLRQLGRLRALTQQAVAQHVSAQHAVAKHAGAQAIAAVNATLPPRQQPQLRLIFSGRRGR